MKKLSTTNIILFVSLIVALIFTSTSHFYLKRLSGNTPSAKEVIVKKPTKSTKIKEYSNKNKATLIEEVDINQKISVITTMENNQYKSVIFDYTKGNELKINEIIKKGEETNFWQKIDYLVRLKYPKFIADVLKNNNGRNVYYFKKNELVIYYYDYNIEPKISEELYIRVNYNEIKDYFDIDFELDSAYQNEDGNTININKKIIALTFDDGPGSYTKDLVNILKDNKVTASFFMLGKNLESFRETVKYVDDSGMDIGYHSYAHTNFKRQELSEIQNEFAISNAMLQSITGKSFTMIRPPYGSITKEIKKGLDASFILWNIDTMDWRYKDPTYLTNYVLDNAKDGSIILFHDIHKTSIETIKELLPKLYASGYQVVSVSKLAEAFQKPINNHQTYRFFTR